MLWIHIRSPIFSMYSWCSKNQSLILICSSYTSVRFNSVSISDIEYFERSMNHTAFILFIHIIYYYLQFFSGHLNGHNHDFLFVCDAYVYAVELLVSTINLLKIIVRF